MRFSILSLLLGVATVAVTAAEDAPSNSVFNGKKVPPLLELNPDNYEKELNASKYLLVKMFSPYCTHCMDYAPMFKTAHEFYYTSKPPASAADADFTKFYNFRFASLDCVAYYDLCNLSGISSYPTTVLFTDGVKGELIKGVRSVEYLSKMIEPVLEEYKPGSRPKSLALPSAGATSAPTAAADGATSKPTDKASAKSTSADGHASGTTDEAAIKDVTPMSLQDYRAKWPLPKIDIPRPQKASNPNKNGLSVSLTAETFQTMVTMTQEPWFIKFYAPWCHHCQAMASNWQQLAKEMQGKLNIGEVNCDVETRLCKDARLRGYPSIMFFKGGERVVYDGLRGLGDFLHYAEKAVELIEGVQDVNAISLSALEEKEEVIFLFFYDHATTSEDIIALERLPLSLIGHAKLVKTADPVLYERFKISTFPRLIVVREGRPTYYNPLTPKDIRDTNQVLSWMKSVWLPIVPELTASNAREIMDGKIVVLGILNRDKQESWSTARKEIKSAANEWMDKQIQLFQLERQELRDAKQLRIEEAEDRDDQRALRAAKGIRINMDRSDKKEVTFAWVDGVFWQRWIRTTYGIDVKDGERVVINDEDNRRYWDLTSTGNPITPSRTSISETINKVTAQPSKLQPKLTISAIEKIFFDIRMTFAEHPYLACGCLIGVAFACISWLRGRSRRNKGVFRLDDTAGQHRAPLLGGNTNGKVD